MGFTFTQPDGSKRTVDGYVASAPSDDDKHYDVASAHLDHLPHKVDLRHYMSPVENQGRTNSCASNAVAGAYEYLVKRHKGQEGYDVSRMFIYYNARAILNPDVDVEDKGSALKANIMGLNKFGAPCEESWPFDPEQVNATPSDEVYEEAGEFLVEDFEFIDTDLVQWKTALASGHPIIFGCTLFNSFGKWRRPGHVEMPTSEETQRDAHGRHAMLCVGYSDPDQVFIIRNSWGEEWGVGGYCYIPYNYLMNPEHNINDSWIIERLESLPVDEENLWIDDEENMLEDVSGVLAGFDDEQWAHMVDRMGETPLEVRLALLFLRAAGADGELAGEELTTTAEHVEPVLEQLGSHLSVETLLNNALALIGDEELVEETIEIFNEVFDNEVLASITNQLQETISADDETHEDEQTFVDHVIEQWQVAPAEEEEEEGEEEEEEEEEGEEEEEEDEDEVAHDHDHDDR